MVEKIDTQASILSYFSPEILSDETDLENNAEFLQDDKFEINLNDYFERYECFS